MKKLFLFLSGFIFSQVLIAGEIPEVITGTDELAQLPFWELRTQAMSLRLVQRLPDQTRAYFSGRGFLKKDVEIIAGYCVFQSVYTNTAPTNSEHVIEYDASQWRIEYANAEQSLALREDWRSIWDKRGVKPAQKIAFEWSLLPTKQRYQPTDYNWGMTLYKLPHGAQFNLNVSWRLNGVGKSALIKDIRCAKDVYIPPADNQ